MSRLCVALCCCTAAFGLAACAGPEARAGADPEPRGADAGAVPAVPVNAAGGHPLPGDRLAFRFVDHAGEARVLGELAPRWAGIAQHPQRALLPYGRLDGEAAFRAVEVAFADSDVEDYATPREHRRPPKPTPRYDPIWNRTRAVYLSRAALYAPAGIAQRYTIDVPKQARLETALGLLAPPFVGARFVITVDDEVVLDRRIGEPERWTPVSVDLARYAGRRSTFSFSVADVPAPAADDAEPADAGGSAVHGFFADPLLWEAGGGAPGPNLLVILVDTLRADALAYMPHLAAWSRRGARFEQAISAATWTRPSLLGLYGGDAPSAVGQSAEAMIPEDAERRAFYRASPPLLTRLLGERGYRVSAIGNNFFLLAYPQIGLDLGFEEVDDVRHPVLDTPAITRAAIRFLDENRERSFLLHLHYDAPHWPYTPPPEYLARIPASATAPGDAALHKDRLWRRYLAEAAYADDYVGRVLAELERLGIADRTLVVLVGDHGEIFDPAHDHVVDALSFPTLHHHGWSAYDEVVRVPLLIVQPGAVPPAVCPSQVGLADVPATVADYLSQTLPLPAHGRSLRPLIEGREHADRPAFVEGQNVRALRAEGYLYLRRGDGRLSHLGRSWSAIEELYDLAADPLQHHDLTIERPDALARLREAFDRAVPRAPPDSGVVYHLRVAPMTAGARAVRIEGTFRASGRLSVRGATGAEITPLDGHAVHIRIAAGGAVDLEVNPPEAQLQLAFTEDGLPLGRERVLAGEFALPLLDGDLAGERLSRLDARRPPILGERGELLLWRDAGGSTGSMAAASTAATAASGPDEVTGMMQRWGYAQPGKK